MGIGKNTDHGVEVRVHPTFVANSNPLASVNDSFNAVHLVGDSVGEIMLYGRGAGALPTGSAIVSDVIFAAKHPSYFYTCFKNTEDGVKDTKFVNDFTSQYFIRLSVQDYAGVLSKIAGVFAKHNVSIKQVKQAAGVDGKVPVVIITHECPESAVNKALVKLEALDTVYSIDSLIRLED